MDNLPTNEEIEFLFNALDIEKEREMLPHPTDAELFSWFPEARAVIQLKINEWKEKRILLTKHINEILVRINESPMNAFSKQFNRDCVKYLFIPELVEIDKHLFRLHRQHNFLHGKKPRDGLITQEQIDQANTVPIQALLPGPFRKSSRNLVCLCPLHKEKTPSFTVFTKTNTFKCFGCQQGGNSIKLIQLLYNYNFKEAVKNLINNY